MDPTITSTSPIRGVDAFIADVSRHVAAAKPGRRGCERLVNAIARDYAYIQLRDVDRPLRFLRQMAGAPPIQFGTDGFASALVDDLHPARHYTAFVFIGYWLPRLPAILFLWAWEIVGFIRYRGHWSQNDINSGYVGIRHGRLVRRYGPSVLPGLIAADVAERTST